MNKKGNIAVGFLVALMVFMVGMLFVNIFKPEITTFRTDMDCTNSTISDGTKATCLIGDVALPYYILIIISAAIGFITNKFIGGRR